MAPGGAISAVKSTASPYCHIFRAPPNAHLSAQENRDFGGIPGSFTPILTERLLRREQPR